MGCIETFIPRTKFEQKIADEFGMNNKVRDTYLALAKTAGFRAWYKQKYNKKFSEDDNKNVTFAAIKKYYHTKYLDVNKNSTLKSTIGRFSSYEAQNQAVSYLINRFLRTYYDGAVSIDTREYLVNPDTGEETLPNPRFGEQRLKRFGNRTAMYAYMKEQIYRLAKQRADDIIARSLPEDVAKDFLELATLLDDYKENSKQYSNLLEKYVESSTEDVQIEDAYDIALLFTNNKKIAKLLKERNENKKVDDGLFYDFLGLMSNILTDKNLATVQEQNIYAMFEQFEQGEDSEFCKDIWNNANMKDINNLHLRNSEEYDDVKVDADTNNGKETSEGDQSIAKANTHLGSFDNYQKHCDAVIRSYLSTLEEVDDVNTGTPNTDNELGLPINMNVSEVMTVLNQYTNKLSAEDMRNSIARIARDVPGMKGLIKIYNDTAPGVEGSYDLLFALYTVFGKMAMPKSQVHYDGTKTTVTISNERALKINALRMRMLNEFRSTALSIDSLSAKKEFNRIKELKSKYNGTVESRTEILKELTSFVGYIMPTMKNGSVEAFLLKDGSDGFIKNCNSYLNYLYNIIDDIDVVQRNYNDLRQRQYNVRKAISDITKDISTYNFKLPNGKFDREAFDRAIQERIALRKQLDALYKEDYSTAVQPSLFSLADNIVDYSYVPTNLNSPNIHGDMSSDVLNNNMMTNILNTLQDKISSENFAKEKFQSTQYNFSNILLETEEHFGLFRKELSGTTIDPNTGETVEHYNYVPTEYAKDMIRFELFDGVRNDNTAVAALYSEMTRSDYIVTAMNEYFKEENVRGNINTARYFTRIPSDAPKTFIMRAPKYDIRGLFTVNGINRNHVIFKMFKNLYLQEIQDAVTALSHIFEIENGSVKFDDRITITVNGQEVENPNFGKPVFKEGLSNETKDARKAFDVYHTKTDKAGNTYFYSEDANGKIVELVGKVFHSDRFVISTTQRNYGEELLGNGLGNGIINFLYGRESEGNGLKIDNSDPNNVKYTLNETQEAAIDNMIESFMNDYIADSNDRLSKSYVKVDEAHNNDTDKIDFYLNTFLTYASFNDILEGDTKFYKDAQTFLKRAKELQASGVPYGIVNYRTGIHPDCKPIASRLDEANIVLQGKKVILRNGFKGVTVKNTIRISEEAERLFGKKGHHDESQLVKKGIISKETAERLHKLYDNTKTNDAQSYITLDEWIRRITARGQYARYEELIKKLTDENDVVDPKDVDEFVQVQKNYYYDQHYNSEFGVTTPRQIKNAEFVIIPKFVKGTDLERVYNVMKKYDIDQLNTAETSKAGKANVLTLWNNDGVLTDEALADFEYNVDPKNETQSVEVFSYNNLYLQQDVAQHMDTENKAGIQIFKKILDNIPEDSPLYKKKQELIDAYCTNIKESFLNVMNKLGVPINPETGYPELVWNKDHYEIKGLDYTKLFERMQEETQRLGVNSNVAEFFELDKYGNPIMPPFMSNVSTKLESIIQSIFNNGITRQKLPGFHAAQVTGVGIAGKWKLSKGDKKAGIKTSNQLRYHPYRNGEIKSYAEVIIPKPAYLENYSNEDALRILNDTGLDKFIGYRIPTEGKQSISVMKVVGFLDKSQGSTIIVPDDWVAQTGADFDVDSIYSITMMPDLNEKGYPKKTDGKFTVSKNMDNKANRNNLIVQNMIDILSDPISIEENLSCSNFADTVDAINIILKGTPVEKQKKSRSPYNFFDQCDFQEDAVSGLALKGMSVARDTLCSVCNTVKPTITSPIQVSYNLNYLIGNVEESKREAAKKKKVDELIKRFGEKAVTRKGDKVFITHETFGWSADNKNIAGRLITAYSSQTTAHILDAIKEGNIPNVNILTFPVYKMFPDMGSDYMTAVSFMMTPGVTRIVANYNESRSIYADNSSTRNNDSHQFAIDSIKQIAAEIGLDVNKYTKISDVLAKLEEVYGDRISELFGVNFSGNINSIGSKVTFDSQLQIDRIKEQGIFNDNETKLLYDILTCCQYAYLADSAQKVGDYARVLNPDKFGAKVSTYETRKVLEDIRKLTKDKRPILIRNGKNIISGIYSDLDFTKVDWLERYVSGKTESLYPTLNSFLKYATITSILVETKVFVTEKPKFRRLINKLKDYLGRNLTEKEYNEFKKYILSNVYRQTRFLQEDSTNASIEESDSIDRITGINQPLQFVCEVNDITEPTEEEKTAFKNLTPAQKVLWIKQRSYAGGIFDYLDVSISNPNSDRYSSMQTITFNPDSCDVEKAISYMKLAWRNRNWFVKETVRDLFKYAIVAENYSMSRRGITRIIPNLILRDTNFVKDVTRNVEDLSLNDSTYINFIRGHADSLGIPAYKFRKAKISSIEYNTLSFNLGDPNSEAYKYKLVTEKDCKPFIKVVDPNTGETTLMRGTIIGNMLLYTPLNKLLPNENSDFSVKDSENIYPKDEFYIGLIDYMQRQLDKLNATNNTFTLKVNDYIAKHEKANHVIPLNLTTLAENNFSINALVNELNNYGNSNRIFYFRNSYLATLRPSVTYGDPNSFCEYINTSNRKFRLIHVDSDAKFGGTTINSLLKYANDKRKEGWSVKQLINSRLNNQLPKGADVLLPILQSAIEIKAIKLNDVFYATPVEENTTSQTTTTMNASVLGDVLYDGVIGLRNRKNYGDEAASLKMYEASQAGINLENKDSVDNNQQPVADILLDYTRQTSASLMKNLEEFWIDPSTGVPQSIDSPGILEYLQDNPSEINRLAALIGDIRSFIFEMNMVAKNKFDTSGEEETMKNALNEISRLIQTLERNNLLSKANQVVLDYLKNQSDDPLIINELYDYTQGFHNIGVVENLITDAQEAPIPLMQIILHQATSRVRGEDMKTYRAARNFKKKIESLISTGRVNFDNIIDPTTGSIRQKYNNTLIDDFKKFQKELSDIINDPNKGRDSREYIRKEHEYRKWKYENFNQRYTDEYYKDVLANEDEILDKDNGFELIYAEYKKLCNERINVLSKSINGNLTEDQKNELDRIQQDIDQLISAYGKDSLVDMGLTNRATYSPAEWIQANKSAEAARALQRFISVQQNIKDKYFNKNEKEGFRDALEEKLDYIQRCENWINGVPTTPQSVLDLNEEYKNAKRWIQLNARLDTTPEFKAKMLQAFHALHTNSGGHSKNYLDLLRTIPNVRDEYGVVDARKLTDIQRTHIKMWMKQDYQGGKLNGFDYGQLITNSESNPFVYSMDFWKMFMPNGMKNSDYINLVNAANVILNKVYDPINKRVDFFKKENDEFVLTEDDLRTLVSIYQELTDTKKTIGSTNGRVIANNIRFNADVSMSPAMQAAFNEDKGAAEAIKASDINRYNLIQKIIYTYHDDGSGNLVAEPSRFLYSTLKPKGGDPVIVRDADGFIIRLEGNTRFVDVAKTIANDTIKNFTYKTTTKYYDMVRKEVYRERPGESPAERQRRINEWLERNHIYNPYTHTIEPIDCWTKSGYKGGNINLAAASGTSGVYHYEPRFAQMETEIKSGENGEPDYRNPDYKDENLFANYKGTNTNYNSNLVLTAEEQQVKDEFEAILNAYSNTASAKKYIQNGNMPAYKAPTGSHSARWHAKQALGTFGWIYGSSQYIGKHDVFIDYEHDYVPPTPGLRELRTEKTKEISPMPKRADYPDQATFDAAIANWYEEKRQIEEENRKASAEVMDRDWLAVMERFIVEAGHYNAVQEQKHLIYFGLDYLRHNNVYSKDLGKDEMSPDRHESYGSVERMQKEGYGEGTLAVYEAFARRFIFNQFKKDQGRFTRIANMLQQMSSAKYMMVNTTGAISNVLMGESQIMMESFAKEYWNGKDWAVGKQLWFNSIGSFGAHLYDDKASEIGDALCKEFNTLEFDSITELHEDNPNAEVKWKRVRNALYAGNSIGEHFMQNGALLTLLANHRLIKIKDRVTGKEKYVAWSEDRYMRDCYEQALYNTVNDRQAFLNFLDGIKKDKNSLRDILFRKDDPIHKYLRTLSKDEQEKFVAERKRLEAQAKEEFAKAETLFDQFELVDGYAEFKANSILTTIGEDAAYRLLGEFKNKVISVNKKVHGVYDRLGAARIEQYWIGGLIMQYHKHIWPGIMKRWRRQGYYNEDRQSTEKGAYISLFDFLSIPYKDMKEMNAGSKEIMVGIQNYFKAASEFLMNLKLNYQTLPAYEQANIRRVLGEICAYMSAVAVALALKMGDDDDDNKEGIPYNLCIYLADRFATETIMYTPYGALGEAKTLWSSPIAAQTNVGDILESISILAKLIVQGDDYDPTYKTGMYAGENKLKILISRNIPIVRSTQQLWRLPKNNKYYKRQSNGVGSISEEIISIVSDDEEED